MLITNISINTDNKEEAENSGEAFTVFYERYMPKVYRYISFRIGDENMAQDITSTVFEKALTKFSGFNPQKASFATWIFTIARNTVIDHYRTRKKDEYLDPEMTVCDSVKYPSPEDEAIRTEKTLKLRVFLSGLKQREQEIIILKYSNGMSNWEIGEVLKITETNVGSILCRTIGKLRDSFEGWENE